MTVLFHWKLSPRRQHLKQSSEEIHMTSDILISGKENRNHYYSKRKQSIPLYNDLNIQFNDCSWITFSEIKCQMYWWSTSQVHLREHTDDMSYFPTHSRKTKERHKLFCPLQARAMKSVHSNILTWGMTREENKYDIWFEFPFPCFSSWNKDAALLVGNGQAHLMEKIPVRQKVSKNHLLHFWCTGKKQNLDSRSCLFAPDEVFDEPSNQLCFYRQLST